MDGSLRRLFRENMPEVHWQSIETGMTGRGIPDSNGCYLGSEFWVEFKWIPSGWRVPLRPEQIGWLLTRSRHGGSVFVAIRKADELWLLNGGAARDLKDHGLRKCPPEAVLGVWPGGPTRWPWGEVLAHLARTGARRGRLASRGAL